MEERASDWYLPPEEAPEALDDDDLPEGEVSSKISLALPVDHQQALAELQEVGKLLRELVALLRIASSIIFLRW